MALLPLFPACALERRGNGDTHVVIPVPGPPPAADGGTAAPDGGAPPAPSLARLTLTVAGPGIEEHSVTLAPGATGFELDLPAGPARELSILGEEAQAGALVPCWWGAVTVDLPPGGDVTVVIPVAPAGTLQGALYAAGVPLTTPVQVRLSADAPRPDFPAALLVRADTGGRFRAVVPTGAYAIGLATPDAVPGLRAATGQSRAHVVQGATTDVPVELLPADTAQAVVALVLELAGGTLAGLPAATPADLWVRAVDATGAPAPLTGTVTFAASDLAFIAVSGDVAFTGQSEQRLAGAVHALVALGTATLRAHVVEQPAVGGQLTIDILDGTTLPGPAVTLHLELPVLDLATGLFAHSADLGVTALDATGLVATGYRGTVTFAGSDVLALLVPPDYTYVPADAGHHAFVGGLRGIGLPGTLAVIRVSDRADPSIHGELAVTLISP